METKKRPSVLSYLDLQSYLRDYYQARKDQEPEFSYESWSQELNFNKSRSFLRMIVIGKKKASKAFVDSFTKANFQDPREEEYFHYLVSFSQAASAKDKQAFSQKMIQVLRSDTHQKVVENFSDLVSSPVMPRLLTLLSFKDLEPVTETYARLLDVEVPQAEMMLEKLCELGLAEKVLNESQQTQWKTLNSRFKVKDNQGSMDLQKYHRESLHDAIDAFAEPKKLRRYKSLLLPMSEAELEEFYAHLDNFAAEQFTRFTSDFYENRRVFQANFNVHPVTKTMDASE